MPRRPSTKNHREAGLYLATGVLGSIVDALVFVLAIWSGMGPLVSQWVSSSAGAIHNSIIHHYVVFSHTRTLRQTVIPNTALSIASVLLSGPAILALNQIIESIWACKVIVLGLTAAISYVIRKLAIFHR